MKKVILYTALLSVLVVAIRAWAQNPENWTSDQLIAPAKLAKELNSDNRPTIFSVGPSAVIPGSIDIGMVSQPTNMAAFKRALANVPKNKEIVIYCGCCPFAHCPNVRPAISALKEAHFTNYHLLDIPNNIKMDWISKGYPVVKS